MLNPHEVVLRASFRKDLAPCVLFPNIPAQIFFGRIPHDNYATASGGSAVQAIDGAADSNKYVFAGNTSQLGMPSVSFKFDPSTYNSAYGSSSTNQPASLRSLVLIRAY